MLFYLYCYSIVPGSHFGVIHSLAVISTGNNKITETGKDFEHEEKGNLLGVLLQLNFPIASNSCSLSTVCFFHLDLPKLITRSCIE